MLFFYTKGEGNMWEGFKGTKWKEEINVSDTVTFVWEIT